jgi:hypothetical protein
MPTAKQHTEPREPLFPKIPTSSKDFGPGAINIGTSDKRAAARRDYLARYQRARRSLRRLAATDTESVASMRWRA